MVLILASVFGALSYVPFIASVAFYPAGSIVSADGFLNRSPVGNGLQTAYEFGLLGLGYVVGKRVSFETDYFWLTSAAYFGSVFGYIVGLPGLDTTTVSGGIFLFENNPLNAAHIQSAFFNSATLMGFLVTGIMLPSIIRERRSVSGPRGDKPSSTSRLTVVFLVAAVIAFLAYLLPPAFSWALSQVVGPSAAATGLFFTLQTNSMVIANPFLFFVLLYFVGNKVNVVRDAGKVIMLLFAAVLVGSIAGNPLGSYASVSLASGMGMFPDYLASATSLATLLTSAVGVSFAGAFVGFAAISLSSTSRMPFTRGSSIP